LFSVRLLSIALPVAAVYHSGDGTSTGTRAEKTADRYAVAFASKMTMNSYHPFSMLCASATETGRRTRISCVTPIEIMINAAPKRNDIW